jgi:hypothetical protein
VALTIFQAFNDAELNDFEKTLIMIQLLYEDFDDMFESEYQEAAEKAVWYLDGGGSNDSESKESNHIKAKKIMDWAQDEKLIFSAINKVAGFEVREKRYMHWWTFLGFFNEIGEGLFTTVLNIRQKKNQGKKLEKNEQEFYSKNKALVDLKVHYSNEEKAERDYLNSLLG